ncbi:TPA_asm: X protein [electric eel bornavirus]|uniref:X protein n=1 Tax=electric eel bornavirus TaxID=3055757 RepID=A0AA48P919_9MONO|nr:TPA_asm: X protein [electric eel bornavirus]
MDQTPLEAALETVITLLNNVKIARMQNVADQQPSSSGEEEKDKGQDTSASATTTREVKISSQRSRSRSNGRSNASERNTRSRATSRNAEGSTAVVRASLHSGGSSHSS